MNQKLLHRLKPENVEVDVIRVEGSEETSIEESELDAPVELCRQKEQP